MPIAANLHELHDQVVGDVDFRFAEPVKLSFLNDNAADPDRPATEIKAVLRVGGGKELTAGGRSSRAWRTKIAAGKAELHIDRATYSGPDIRKGDAVRALSRHGQPWFEVLRVDDRGDTRLVLELGEK